MNAADFASSYRSGMWGKGGFPIQNIEYDGSNNAIYIGLAPRGTADSAAAWIIFKLTYSGSNMTQARISPEQSVWDDRATLTYA